MDAMDNLAQDAASRSSGFATQTMRQTTAFDARPVGSCWRIGAFRGCCDRTGRARWMNWRRSSGGEGWPHHVALFFPLLPSVFLPAYLCLAETYPFGSLSSSSGAWAVG